VTPAFALGTTVTVDVFVSDVNGRNSAVRRATVAITETGPAGSD
jgi:predicted thioesterase